MKRNTHPVSSPTVYSCGNCGSILKTESTKQAEAKLDVCSNCHPAYTGVATKEASGNRIDSFNNRYNLK